MGQSDQSGYRLLTRLARVNRTSAFLAGLVFVLVALFAPGVVGGVLLLLLALALGALAVVTWPVQSPPTRAIRLIALTVLLAVAIIKIG